MTTSNEFLTERDQEFILKYDKLKNIIKKSMGDEIIEAIIHNIVKESKVFDFKSTKRCCYIDCNKSLFILKINEKQLKKHLKKGMVRSEVIKKVFYTEVVSRYISYMMDLLDTNDDEYIRNIIDSKKEKFIHFVGLMSFNIYMNYNETVIYFELI